MRREMRMVWCVMAAAAMAALGACSAEPAAKAEETAAAEEPFSVHGNKVTFEIAPVLLASDRVYPEPSTVKMGGIPNLVGAPAIPGYGEPGVADVATHAETQALRYSVEHPDLRIIMTVAEGYYRIVARKSAGIEKLEDLKGKRIATIPNTSSAFFLHNMLKSVGLSEADVTIQRIIPLSDMPKALVNGDVDAVTIWEPEIENAYHAIGDDAVEFDGREVYREIFGLNTTAANLADPEKRAEIKAYVKAVVEASAMIREDPSVAWRLVVESTGYELDLVKRAWKHHGYPGSMVPDLLDVLEKEEAWLAEIDGRPARTREELATLIDDSIIREVLAEQ